MVKALLIDDEERATDALRLMIEKFIPEINQVAVCNDARLAAKMIHNFQPSLVFLDIRMPHLTGFDILNQIPGKQFKVIFTTAYNEFAVKAIRFSAFDYLLKPIDVEELIMAVKRFMQSDENYTHQQALLQNIMYNMKAPDNGELRLALPTREGIYFVTAGEIIRCEALGNYTKFYLQNNRQFIISKTLGEYEEMLVPHQFIRTHKSHLVNRSFISFIDHEGFIVLKDSTKVEVSRRRKEEVLGALKK
jgi:two-component system, LytTR family, response regulator